MLASNVLLTHYNPSLQITVVADTSNCWIGVVISHTFSNGAQEAVARISRVFTSAKGNYGPVEKEALALVFAIKLFHKFVRG